MENEGVPGQISKPLTYNKQILAKFDKLAVRILTKFLDNDTYVFSILYKEIEKEGFDICFETLRARLKELCSLGFVTKIGRSNPSVYMINDKEIPLIRKIIQDYVKLLGVKEIML